MNEFDIDRLMGGLKGESAGEGFRERLLEESTAALVRGRVFRRRLRATGLTLGILLVAGAAFALGQLSGSTRDGLAEQQQNWTNVPSELVAWLDAGRFFERLGMAERAERAYKMAGELIPYDGPGMMEAKIGGERAFAAELKELRRRGYFERSARGRPEDAPEGESEWLSEITGKVLAQH
jgi:hypothetical protein